MDYKISNYKGRGEDPQKYHLEKQEISVPAMV